MFKKIFCNLREMLFILGPQGLLEDHVWYPVYLSCLSLEQWDG